MVGDAIPLVVGAGPVGLAVALFLKRSGLDVRLIEKTKQREPWSRALAVNPRTLKLLGPTGVADKIRELGKPVVGGAFWWHGKMVGHLDFPSLDGELPRLFALSQATTERLIREALMVAGGTVEHGVELVDCTAVEPMATLKHEDGHTEVFRSPWIFAADGARSAVRHAIDIKMHGDALDRDWHLADVPLDTPMPADRANIVFLDDGFMFMLPVITGEPNQPPIWRLMGNVKDPVSRLPAGKAIGEPVWQSKFHITHRIAERLNDGQVYLGGDAAHLHSPMGARGMNQGIEDAWCFAELLRQNRLSEYSPIRRKIDGQLVDRIRRVTNVAIGESAVTRAARRVAVPVAMRFGVIRRPITRLLTGLDHEPLLAS